MSSVDNPYSYKRAANLQYETVGGWLLFLCFSLCVLRPIVGGFQLYLLTSSLAWSDTTLVGRMIYASAVVLEVSLIVFGLVAGLALWRLRPSGLGLTKAFLLVQFLVPVLYFAGLALYVKTFGGDPSTLLSTMLPSVGRALAYGLIWWVYLARSERVKRTFEMKRERTDGPAIAPASNAA